MNAEVIEGVLSDLRPYTESNWDLEGAVPLTSAALLTMRFVLAELPEAVTKPNVSPIPDGSIDLFWDKRGIYLNFHVHADGSVSFLYKIPGLPEDVVRVFGRDDLQEAIEALHPTFGFISELERGLALPEPFNIVLLNLKVEPADTLSMKPAAA